MKYRTLTGHFNPGRDFQFPQQFQHGYNRTLNIDWLKNTHFLCTVKAKILYFEKRKKFVKGDGFTNFFKIKGQIEGHVESQHSDCVEKAIGLKNDLKTRKIHYHI